MTAPRGNNTEGNAAPSIALSRAEFFARLDALPPAVRRVIQFAPISIAIDHDQAERWRDDPRPSALAAQMARALNALAAEVTLETYGPAHPQAARTVRTVSDSSPQTVRKRER